MLIHWLAIFLVLASFISVDSDELPAYNSNAEGRQWIGDDSTDDASHLNGGSDSLPKAAGIYLPKGVQRIPVHLNQQETIDRRHSTAKGKSLEEKDYQHMIAALTKIAKVKLADEDSVSAEQVSYIRNATRKKLTKLPSKLSASYNASNDGIERGSFHCHAIQDAAYIPEIKEHVPSYACKLGNKMFILSSKRFLEDRRISFRIRINDEMLRRLNSFAIARRNSKLNIIPATLVLKPGREDYNIRNQQNIISHENN